MRKLTKDEISWLSSFNQRLREIQRKIEAETALVHLQLQRRLENTNDPLDDYHIDVKIAFVLHEGDPDFDEDDDNILTKRQHWMTPRRCDSLFPVNADVLHWAEDGQLPDVKNHCYLFHDLYDHCYGPERRKLDVANILRIGRVDVSIQPSLHYSEDIPVYAGKTNTKLHLPLPIPNFMGMRLYPSAYNMLERAAIRIEDIAHGLSNQCMYFGQTRAFYAFAQHSLLVASLVPRSMKLAALLYRAPTAILGDNAHAYDTCCRSPDWTILNGFADKFDFSPKNFLAIGAAIAKVMATEKRDLIPALVSGRVYSMDGVEPLPEQIIPLNPEEARRQYLDEFTALTAESPPLY